MLTSTYLNLNFKPSPKPYLTLTLTLTLDEYDRAGVRCGRTFHAKVRLRVRVRVRVRVKDSWIQYPNSISNSISNSNPNLNAFTLRVVIMETLSMLLYGLRAGES
jgi:hypothetical protein